MDLLCIALMCLWFVVAKNRIGSLTDGLIAKDKATGASGTIAKWFGS